MTAEFRFYIFVALAAIAGAPLLWRYLNGKSDSHAATNGIHLNDMVTVELSDVGLDHLVRMYGENHCAVLYPGLLATKRITCQTWELFRIFGPIVAWNRPNPFVGNICRSLHSTIRSRTGEES